MSWFIFYTVITTLIIANMVWADYRKRHKTWTRKELEEQWYKQNKIKRP